MPGLSPPLHRMLRTSTPEDRASEGRKAESSRQRGASSRRSVATLMFCDHTRVCERSLIWGVPPGNISKLISNAPAVCMSRKPAIIPVGWLMAQRHLFAFLVSDGDESLENLRVLLKAQGIELWMSRSCAEAGRLLEQTRPELIFTTTEHADGTWRDVIALAGKAVAPTNVIVVGKHQSIRLYLAVMECGAFDYILPPFEPEAIGHVVRVAAEDVRRRREAQAIEAVA